MNSNVPGPKKMAICRYWANNRTCFYGDDCQFLHSDRVPNLTTAISPAVKNQMKQGIPDRSPRSIGNSGRAPDQFFPSPFNNLNLVGESNMPFQPDLQHGSMMAKDQNQYLFPGSSGPDGSLGDEMAGLSLASMNDKRGPNPGALEFIPGSKNVSGGSSEFLPGVSEFIPRSKLSSNTSTSSSVFSPMASSHLSTGRGYQESMWSNSMSSGPSPMHSPKLTPTGSPIMMRHRNRSPTPAALDLGSPGTPAQPPIGGKQDPMVSNHIQENIGGTTYFYTQEQMQAAQPTGVYPSFHVYPSEPPSVSYMTPKPNAPSFFLSDELRIDIIHRHLQTMTTVDLAQYPDLPTEVDNYHTLCPLEPIPTSPLEKSSTFGYVTSCYKAVNSKDGKTYCLRRIHGFRLVNTNCMALVDMWKKIQHSNIVTLREVFTTKAFGDLSLVFAHDFHAGAETLMSRHFSNPNMMGKDHHVKNKYKQGIKSLRQHAGLLPESVIWTYVVQLSSALRTIHAAGLACRVMDPTKILLMSKSRLRVNCVGIFDVLTFDNNQSNPLAMMPHYQQEDLVSLGKVVLALACHSVLGIQRENIQASMELVAVNYSEDLKNLILYLLTNQNRLRSVNDIMPMIGARFYTQLDAAQMRSDVIEEDLSKEVQNGRLMRLLAKLNTICERPEFSMDPTWSETGDRYLLKLFRDHVFHQVSDTGAPWMDLAHIVYCLNKLDAGAPEKVCLMSRDEQNVLVVSYSDLKVCFENTFSEILQANQSTPHHPTQPQVQAPPTT
ncbi:PAN2-PAN3 deadenylation complex subunit pan3-like [Saccoglossus kowalevskii]|uniref:PAN2-PAN3 deadenylation complex subunit PAN3 n=1 Tax=Saccoglossus kowalevskii TaxID=10224 RepID=A0ABM0MKG8_SACKO|nr:PREDICTED: PAB-dependent poly(A)-specific ribonuclease subunit 3-like [Saccoglossus kowalevskii]